jgi:hypothetical protein
MNITKESEEAETNVNIGNPFRNHSITESDLLGLGFVRVDVPIEESGDKAFHYYTLDFGDICLITSSNDDLIDGSWWVEIFDFESISFTGIVDLRSLIELLKRNTKQ